MRRTMEDNYVRVEKLQSSNSSKVRGENDYAIGEKQENEFRMHSYVV